MLGNSQFYNRTIRKIVVAFGTLFNDIDIVRYTQSGVPKEKLKIPLSYGAKERYITRLTSDPNLIKTINTLVPRMSFNLDSLEYDSNRKQVSTLRNFAEEGNDTLKSQFVPVPYNFEFSLSIYVRNTEDGTQILEQILPFFTPDFSITVDFIPSMDQKYTVPIILNSVSSTVDFEGAGEDGTTRLIVWDLTFTVKSYIWPPVKSSNIITRANTQAFIDLSSDSIQKAYVDYANGSGVFTQGETVRDTANNFTATVDYFSNTSTGIIVLTNANKIVQNNFTLIGDYSNARYSVNSLDTNSIKVLKVITEPNPTNAKPEEDFGFTETIVEFPNTLS